MAKKPQNIDRRLNMQIETHGLNIRVEDVDLLYNLYRKTKALNSFTVKVTMTCAFVYAYPESHVFMTRLIYLFVMVLFCFISVLFYI